jgi:hypothetical protein
MNPCKTCGAIICKTPLRCDTIRLMSGQKKCNICYRVPCQSEEICNHKRDDYPNDHKDDHKDDLIAEYKENSDDWD